MANMPHLTMGGGRPSAMGDLPIRDQLDPYLKRLRRTVPFPITEEEAYFGCMPAVVKQMAQQGMFAPGAELSDRSQNLMQCLTSSTDGSPTSNKGKINYVHVGTKTDEVFWMHTPENLPIPVYRMGTPFELPLDHPHLDQLTKWVIQCLKIEDGIQRVFAAIAKLEMQARSGAEVAAAWPELLNFVKYRRIFPPLSHKQAQYLREALIRQISAEERRFVTEMLATCVMLPERNQPLTGWVNFYVEGL